MCFLAFIAATMPGEPSAWATNIASIFLNPFGVGSSDSSVSANGTRGDIMKVTKKKLLPGYPVSVACNNQRWDLGRRILAAVVCC